MVRCAQSEFNNGHNYFHVIVKCYYSNTYVHIHGASLNERSLKEKKKLRLKEIINVNAKIHVWMLIRIGNSKGITRQNIPILFLVIRHHFRKKKIESTKGL